MFARAAIYLSFFALLFAAACQEEVVPEIYHPRNDHEAYLHGLQKAGLATTALAKEWALHAQSSLSNPIAIELPFQEAFYFANTTPNAHAYGMTVRRGEKIQITLKSIGTPDIREQAKLFIDLFRIDSTDRDSFDHVASASKSENQLAFEPRQDAHYLIRIQPELLRGGRFEISIRSAPSLEFPVMGGNNRDIGSFFGDPRDGGRRKHHGIDIFARRHTPILAPCKGYIRFVGERGLGGKVVWMRDRQRDMTLYFAHLHEIIAKDDTWVDIGDTLGTVGNTGNARTTPPHLHFGIYSNGPIDPYHFVAIQKSEVKPIAGNLELL
ncbi:MAG: M23 family metallopeptidase, partial [Saprospiraceae bacterium]|nr:M23 family metallopeptidase [Saprospiraceae bacterium]